MRDRTAFIFDLDGTLVDSLDDIAAALNHGLQAVGLDSAPIDEVLSWIGDGFNILCERAAPYADESVRARLRETAARRYAAHSLVHTRLYPNVLQLLALLNEGGHPKAILSNKPHAITVVIADGLGLTQHFIEVRGCLREADRKPSPRVALELAAALRRAPDEIIFVGDSVVDIETARNAGMKSAVVTWGFQKKIELEAANPDFLIESPLEIARLA